MKNMHLVRLGQAAEHEQQGCVPTLAKGAARMLSSDGGYIINSKVNRNLIKVSHVDAGHRDDLTQAKMKIAEQN
jgi:hypothetical protein